MLINVESLKLEITIDNINVNDYLIFEEKKIEPGTQFSTDMSVGLINAVKYFFPRYVRYSQYTQGDPGTMKPLTHEVMTELGFESFHLIKILGKITEIEGDLIIKDDAESYDESNHFIFNGYEIKRGKIPWSDTPQFIKMQGGQTKIVNPIRLNSQLIRKYFTINDEPITDNHFSDCSLMPLSLFLVMAQRLGKLLKD